MSDIFHPPVVDLPPTRRPRVSVLVTCFNYGHWLADCVESALKQEAVETDIIIVDDASTDDSADVAQRLMARHGKRIRFIRHVSNRGHISSVNESLDFATGDYIVKLDADDQLPPGSLARAIALLEAWPEVGFVYGRPLHFGFGVDVGMSRLHRILMHGAYHKSERPTERDLDTQVRSWTMWSGQTWIDALCNRGANCISQPEVVMRASTVRAVGNYNVDLPHTSDLAMWLALASISDVGRINGPIQGFYRVHSSSMQRTVNAGKLRDLLARLAAFEAVLGNSRFANPDSALMLARARRRLASEALDEACRAFDRGLLASEPVEDYVSFAMNASRQASSLSEWGALQHRRRVGAHWAPFYPPFIVGAVLRRAKREIRALRWWRSGT